MFHPDQSRSPITIEIIAGPNRNGGCLVDGCPCKDTRILSHRRAAFFAAMARRACETADRVIAPDPSWSIVSLEGAAS